MDKINSSDQIDHRRRRFFGGAARSVAAAQFGMIGFANAQGVKPEQLPTITPRANASFAPLKQIDAGLLSVGYAEGGPPAAPRSFFCTAGLTTFIAMSMSRLCWPPPATG